MPERYPDVPDMDRRAFTAGIVAAVTGGFKLETGGVPLPQGRGPEQGDCPTDPGNAESQRRGELLDMLENSTVPSFFWDRSVLENPDAFARRDPLLRRIGEKITKQFGVRTNIQNHVCVPGQCELNGATTAQFAAVLQEMLEDPAVSPEDKKQLRFMCCLRQKILYFGDNEARSKWAGADQNRCDVLAYLQEIHETIRNIFRSITKKDASGVAENSPDANGEALCNMQRMILAQIDTIVARCREATP